MSQISLQRVRDYLPSRYAGQWPLPPRPVIFVSSYACRNAREGDDEDVFRDVKCICSKRGTQDVPASGFPASDAHRALNGAFSVSSEQNDQRRSDVRTNFTGSCAHISLLTSNSRAQSIRRHLLRSLSQSAHSLTNIVHPCSVTNSRGASSAAPAALHDENACP